MVKLIFLDADDTFLTPPYQSIRRIAAITGIRNFPPEQAFMHRSHIDFHVAFPHIFRSKNHAWGLALLSLPFGFFKSYKIFDEIDLASFRALLSRDDVIVLSKNPPSFAKKRVRRIKELVGVDISSRYIACGPILSKSTPKIEIIKRVALERGLELSDCLLIDDSVENIQEAHAEGVKTLLIQAPWNQDYVNQAATPSVARHLFVNEAFSMLPSAAPKTSQEIIICPNQDHIAGLRKSFPNAQILPIHLASRWNVFRKGPHNVPIDAFRTLITRADFLETRVVIADSNGFQKTISAKELKRFVPKQPELARATAVVFRSYCRREFDKQGYVFELPSFFNIYYRSRSEVVAEVFADLEVASAREEYAKAQSVTMTEANEVCKKHINTMIYSRTYRGCFWSFNLVKFLMSMIFRSIRVNVPERLENIEEDHFTIFAPIHRSMLDSGILFVEIGKTRQHLPYIVSADKMYDVWLGRLGSYTGAFFIARKHIDNIYTAVLTAHLKQIHRDGASLEVFIEGARSRSGLTLPPKKGIISSVERNMKFFPGRPVAVVPVAFVYNKLPESEMLLSEVFEERRREGKVSLREQADFLIRKRKRKKSLPQKLSSVKRRLTAAPVSDCYIDFSEAVHLESSAIPIRGGKASLTDASIQGSLNEVMFRINRMTPILPSSVICLALLASKEHHVTKENIEKFLDLSHDIISLYGLAGQILFEKSQAKDQIEESLRLPFINRKFKRVGIDERWILSLTELDSTRAAHYKNNILHYFVLPAMLANILTYSTKAVKKEELHRYLDHLFKDLSIKYFLPITEDVSRLINDVIAIFTKSGYISQHTDSYLFKGETDDNVPFVLLSNLAEDFAKSDLLYAFSRFRRAFQRIELVIEANLVQDDKEYTVTIQNLSVGGALISFDAPLHKDSDIKLLVPYDGKSFAFKGRFSRFDDGEAGIQFVEIDEIQGNILLMIISYYSSFSAEEMPVKVPVMQGRGLAS